MLYTYHLTCNSSLCASCTHYTSYSLLNIVHVIVCVFWSDQPSLKFLWVFFFFLCKTYFVFEILKGECLKILIFGKLCLNLVFWKSISSHTHAFYFLYSMLWGVFSKIKLFFSKKMFLPDFRLIQTVFRSIEISFKILGEPLSVSIDWNYFLINRISWIKFLKNRSWLFQNLFFKSFLSFSLSLWFGLGSTLVFCYFLSFFLQGFPL